MDWALGKQRENGWFDNCCLTDPEHPLTHTIGYVLRGVLESYRFAKREDHLAAAVKTADALLGVIDDEGFLPGRLDSKWQAAASSSCLTGSAQIATCWFLLCEITGDTRYRDAALAANRFVRRTVALAASPDISGGIKGSFPVDGDYNPYRYLNWAAKFFIDSNLIEQKLDEPEQGDAGQL